MPSLLRHAIVPACCILTLSAWMVLGSSEKAEHVEVHPEHEHAELAPFMAQLQQHSQKLGFAIEGQNTSLAEFYLHEITEVLEEIEEEIPIHDKLPIAELIKKIPEPMLAPLDKEIEAGHWHEATQAYSNLINACNSCHAATQHEFIVITPANGNPPFNQLFTPQKTQRPADSN